MPKILTPFEEYKKARNAIGNTALKTSKAIGFFERTVVPEEDDNYWKILFRHLTPVWAHKSILVIECGLGDDIDFIHNKVKRIDGVEFGNTLVRVAQKRLKEFGVPKDKYQIFLSNGTDLKDISDQTYHLVKCNDFIDLFPTEHRLNFLKEFYRVLYDGGGITLILKNSVYKNPVEVEKLKTDIKQAGFNDLWSVEKDDVLYITATKPPF